MKIQHKGKKLGITGSTGVLGRILCSECEKTGISYCCFKGDITDKNDVTSWVKSSECEYIIHLAALVPTDKVKDDPMQAYAINVGGTINLLQALNEYNSKCEWFFYASSSHVYKSSDKIINEGDPTEPISLYGKTKLMGENICTQFSDTEVCRINICSGRIFSYYHDTQKPPFLYPNILNRLATEDLSKPFFLYGADCLRDFLSAEEVVGYILKLMNNNQTGIINIASGTGIKIRDFVQRLSGQKLCIVTNDDTPNTLVADITKLNIAIGLNNE